MLHQAGASLHHLHHHGVMHRDFRCANILVASLQPLVLKAADFGVSHRLSRFTTPGAPSTAAGAHVASVIAGPRGMGPPWWMAPEALEAVVGDGGAVVGVHVTPATDVYMFGGLAFEVLTGGVHPYHWVHADLLLLRRRTAVDVEVRVPGFTPCCGLRHLSTVEAAERDGVAAPPARAAAAAGEVSERGARRTADGAGAAGDAVAADRGGGGCTGRRSHQHQHDEQRRAARSVLYVRIELVE
jgi:hypothetical protein